MIYVYITKSETKIPNAHILETCKLSRGLVDPGYMIY